MEQISALELSQRLNNPEHDLFLLDVREPNEYAHCHIKGSHLIPMHSIPHSLGSLPKDTPIIAICHHGMRSQQVAQFLIQNSFNNVINLTGGVHAWAVEVDPQMPTY